VLAARGVIAVLVSALAAPLRVVVLPLLRMIVVLNVLLLLLALLQLLLASPALKSYESILTNARTSNSL
jgi:hypothetical protein